MNQLEMVNKYFPVEALSHSESHVKRSYIKIIWRIFVLLYTSITVFVAVSGAPVRYFGNLVAQPSLA